MQKCIAHLLGDPDPRVGLEGESYSPVVTLGFDEDSILYEIYVASIGSKNICRV